MKINEDGGRDGARSAGSVRGSETGVQPAPELRSTAPNCVRSSLPTSRQISKPAVQAFLVAYRHCDSRGVSASLTRKRSLVQSQYRPP